MRRNSSTIVVLAGQVPAEVLAAASRSMNVALYRPEPPGGTEGDDGGPAAASLEAGTAALQRSARSHRVVLVPATEPAEQAEGVLHARFAAAGPRVAGP
jgi:hypothetical protein